MQEAEEFVDAIRTLPDLRTHAHIIIAYDDAVVAQKSIHFQLDVIMRCIADVLEIDKVDGIVLCEYILTDPVKHKKVTGYISRVGKSLTVKLTIRDKNWILTGREVLDIAIHEFVHWIDLCLTGEFTEHDSDFQKRCHVLKHALLKPEGLSFSEVNRRVPKAHNEPKNI